jgi:hypothetical protein
MSNGAQSTCSIGSAAAPPETSTAAPIAPTTIAVDSQTMVGTGRVNAPATRPAQSASSAAAQIRL